MNNWYEPGHVAIVTGGSRGLGRALTRELLDKGLFVIIDGRDEEALAKTFAELGETERLIAIPGDVADKNHVHALVAEAKRLGRLDLLVNNASTLGETPLPRIDQLSEPTFARLFAVNVFAPIHLIQHALPLMQRGSDPVTVVNITSDAGVEAYSTWGGYGATKAALEHVSRVLAAEIDDPNVRILVADPGDMDTQMHRDAVPGANPLELRDPTDAACDLITAIAEMRSRFERVRLGAVTVA